MAPTGWGGNLQQFRIGIGNPRNRSNDYAYSLAWIGTARSRRP